MRTSILAGLVSLLFGGCLCPSARAIILMGSGDPEVNTTPPAGALEGSGWELQGAWGVFLGTPVGPNLFLTARHVGGAVGDRFTVGGAEYVAFGSINNTNSDLRLWRVCGTFPRWATICTNQDEAGRELVVFGRGTQRGAELRVPEQTGGLRGWLWGDSDKRMRWGQNLVTGVVDGNSLLNPEDLANGPVGELLEARFDSQGGTNEAHLSSGDSGGAVFIQVNGAWQLAGISYSVSGPYNTSTNGPGFNAAVFDERGLYEGAEGEWIAIRAGLRERPGALYATRVSSHRDWIQRMVEEAGSLPAVQLEEAALPDGPFAEATMATHHASQGLWTVSAPDGQGHRFYRLRSCCPTTFTRTAVENGNLLMWYECR